MLHFEFRIQDNIAIPLPLCDILFCLEKGFFGQLLYQSLNRISEVKITSNGALEALSLPAMLLHARCGQPARLLGQVLGGDQGNRHLFHDLLNNLIVLHGFRERSENSPGRMIR